MIKIRRIKSRQWRGNGMGYEPAEYSVERNGKKIAEVQCGANGDWYVSLPDGQRIKPYSGKFVDARAAALALN